MIVALLLTAAAEADPKRTCVELPAVGERVSLVGTVRLQPVPGPPRLPRPAGLENVPDVAQVLELTEPPCLGDESDGDNLQVVLLYPSTPSSAEQVGMARVIARECRGCGCAGSTVSSIGKWPLRSVKSRFNVISEHICLATRRVEW
jgi:hypothetical protein